ncbi:hypothetical protein CRYUN_Cryun01aG0108000 [Craigia yunnanensis]
MEKNNMNPSSLELSLSLKPSYVPKSLSNLLTDLSKIDNESDKLSVLSDYICKHHEELSRVEALKHELPQCRLLLMEDSPDQEEYSNPSYAKKQKTSVLDNFQPPNLKAIQACKELLLPYKESSSNAIGSSITGKEKQQNVAMDDQYSSRNQAGFLYLKTDDIQTQTYYPKPLTQPIWKNNRRCWSSELHARFMEALNLLGGIEVATPKQIRDFMQVEGLTIDQVKSHLQVEFDLVKINNACIMFIYSS